MIGEALCVGVDEQLVGVEAMPLLRLERPVGAVAVELSRTQARDIAVPDLPVPLGQVELLDLFLSVL